MLTPVTVGFCTEAVKLFGPDQVYAAPDTVLAVRDNVKPEQTALLLPAVGAPGAELTTAVVVPAELVQPFTVADTE